MTGRPCDREFASCEAPKGAVNVSQSSAQRSLKTSLQVLLCSTVSGLQDLGLLPNVNIVCRKKQTKRVKSAVKILTVPIERPAHWSSL